MTITSRGSPDQVSDPTMTDAADWFPANREQTLGLWQVSTCPLKNVAGTDTITADADVAPLDSYQKGQGWTLVPANTNTGAVTLNIDGKGARTVRRSDGTALEAGDLIAGCAYALRDNGSLLQVMSQLGSPGPQPVQTYLELTYEQPVNTDGGAATSGARQTYPLNTALTNTVSGATFNTSTSVIALPAGTYKVEAVAAFHPATNAAAIYLRNDADSVDVDVARQQATAGGSASLGGVFTIAATKTFRLQYSVVTSQGANGLGVAVNDAGTATERYGRILFTRVA